MGAAVEDRFSRLGVWERDGVRAPHKPLLVLYALGRIAAGDRGPVRFADAEGPLRDLLARFGPPRRRHHPEFPFWYLRTDGVWEVTPDAGYPPRKGHTSPSAAQLRGADAAGQFTPEVRAALAADPGLVGRIAHSLLDAHFPASLHEDILAAVGLELGATAVALRRPRDPAFREAVLRAYGYACAVCGLDLRLGDRSVGVEAAHVRWHAAGGPDVVPNGLCLCVLHHKLFDLGALTLSADAAVMLVSDAAHGGSLEQTLLRHHRRPVARPGRAEYSPRCEFVEWHRGQVFRGVERD